MPFSGSLRFVLAWLLIGITGSDHCRFEQALRGDPAGDQDERWAQKPRLSFQKRRADGDFLGRGVVVAEWAALDNVSFDAIARASRLGAFARADGAYIDFDQKL